MVAFLLWLIDHWLLMVWGAGIVLAYVYGGRYAALLVATLGFGAFMYNRGKSEVNKKGKEIEEKRENAYDEIDNRGTDRDDVVERLRNRTF